MRQNSLLTWMRGRRRNASHLPRSKLARDTLPKRPELREYKSLLRALRFRFRRRGYRDPSRRNKCLLPPGRQVENGLFSYVQRLDGHPHQRFVGVGVAGRNSYRSFAELGIRVLEGRGALCRRGGNGVFIKGTLQASQDIVDVVLRVEIES